MHKLRPRAGAGRWALPLLLCWGSPVLAESPASAPLALVAPALVTFVPAEYPDAARLAGVEGVVGLLLDIDTQGKVTAAEILSPAGFGLDEAARNAALQFVFSPARENGAPVPSRVTYRYRFSLSPAGRSHPGGAPLDDGAQPPASFSPEVFTSLAEQAALSGQLWEKGSRHPVREAALYLLSPDGQVLAETEATPEGFFSFPSLAPGPYTLRVRAPGFEFFSHEEELSPGESVSLELRITPEAGGYGLTVRGEEQPEVIRRSLSKQEVLSGAGTQGDIMRAVTNLPGVARAPLSTGVLIIRGSSPEDTRTNIGGLWVPHIYHLTGMTSVLNPEMIERLDFFPGAYGARYGRVNGGILDVIPSTGDPERLRAVVDVDIYDAGASIAGPAGKDASFAVGARRSYIDSVLGTAIPLVVDDPTSISLQTAPRSYDYQGLYQRKLGKGTLRLLGMGAGDSVGLIVREEQLPPVLNGAISADSLFHLLSANYRTQGKVSHDATVGLLLSSASGEFGPEIFGDYSQDALMARSVSELNLWKGARLALGGDLLASWFEARGRSFLPPVEGGESPPPGTGEVFETQLDSQWIEGGVFAEVRQALGRWVVVPGLRFDRFGGTRELLPQPRLGATYALSTKTTLRANAGLYAQDPIPFELDESFGNPDLRTEKSFQGTLGVVHSADAWRIDVDLFYKGLWDVITRSGSGASVRELTTNDGTGLVYGAEVMARLSPGKRLSGFVAYTFSRSLRRDGPDKELRPFDFDQPHVLNSVASYRLNRSWNLGARWRLASGNPDTPYIGSIYDADVDAYIPIPGAPNSLREPVFHQLDLRVDREVLLDTWKLTFYFELTNAYNRANPETTIHNFDYSESGLLTGLPILPAFGVAGVFAPRLPATTGAQRKSAAPSTIARAAQEPLSLTPSAKKR